jgi:thiamine kinase-like enzyme
MEEFVTIILPPLPDKELRERKDDTPTEARLRRRTTLQKGGLMMPDSLERKEEEQLRRLLARVPVLAQRELTLEPLGGGLTNRNYLVDADSEAYVLRVAGADTAALGIDRDQEVACSRAAAAAGVGPEVVAYLPEQGAILTRFVVGRTIKAANIRKPKTLRRVTEAIRRCHALSAPAGAADFSPFAVVRRQRELAKTLNVSLPSELDGSLGLLDRLEGELRTDDPPCLCHNDLLPANFIDDGQRVWIIDWEFAGRGDRHFDLGSFAANCELNDAQERALAEAYFGEARAGDLRRLRLMRLVSDLREAMWGYVQSAVSRLHDPEYYLTYGRNHLNRAVAARAALV